MAAWDDPAGRIRELEAEVHRLRGQLVAVMALAEKWESWSTIRSTPRIDAFRDASEELRGVLPVEDPRC